MLEGDLEKKLDKSNKDKEERFIFAGKSKAQNKLRAKFREQKVTTQVKIKAL